MRHDWAVLPGEVAVDFWLRPSLAEDMPGLAAQLLAEGHDTPALRLVARCAVSDDPHHIRDAFQQALNELGAWIPDRAAAGAIAGTSLARDLVAGRLPIAECADRVRRIWDFDDVVYPGAARRPRGPGGDELVAGRRRNMSATAETSAC